MIKDLDVIDRGLLQLSRLFDDKIDFYDYELVNQDNIDGKIKIGINEIPFTIQSSPAISNINYTSALVREKNQILFIFDNAPKKVIDYCLANQINFIDSNGSCYLKLPDLKIWMDLGTTPVHSNVNKSRAFQKSGLVVLFELFNHPEIINYSYRDISKYCGVSISSLTHIFEDLKGRDFLVENKSSKKKLINCKQLILKWAYSYNENLKPGFHRGYFKFLDENLFNSKILNTKENVFKVSGAKGLSLLNKYIKANQLVLYSNSQISYFARNFKILPTNKIEDDSIEILEPFWNINSYKGNIENELVVDEVLLFADLLNAKDYRIIESAENLLNNEIRNRFIENKFQW